ncbi:immunoglobulin-like domain-containing protein [Listeria fleischmannii]|uniref:Cell wall surface anchor family protein n=1 Tax=Listeria fleischmannii FSL S10-1203 TaxID=1265822 RepID=W7DD10_9LIST|nr:immunoglobulin-like domain-containing protein [Listeria fleischmannii]EUJ47035.1 cell wall surface anchor family protein [Listeria fleischmannii FSL S10-1203]
MTTALIGSQVITTIPFNVLAAEPTQTTNKTQQVKISTPLLKNTAFNDKTGWYPILPSEVVGYDPGTDGWENASNEMYQNDAPEYGASTYVGGAAMTTASFVGNGTLHITNHGQNEFGIAQPFNTVPGHTYSFTYTAKTGDTEYGPDFIGTLNVAFSNYSGDWRAMRVPGASSPISQTGYVVPDGTAKTISFTANSTQTYIQMSVGEHDPDGINGVTISNIGDVIDTSDTTKPIINASDKTLTVGDSYNPLTGVTASDDTDGDITSKIKVTSNNVDTSKAGTYQVSYSVTDAAGNVGTKTITVTVKAAPDTTKPVINASDKTLTVGDSYNPLTGVTASDDTDGDITSKIKVTSNNVDTSKAGTYQVSYSVTDAAGNVGTKTITVTVKEPATQGAVTANTFTINQDSYVTGNFTGGVKKLSVFVNGKQLSTINVTSSPYKFYAGRNITSVNDNVVVVGYDSSGKELDRAQVALTKENPSQGTLTANPFTIGKDGYVTGNFTGDVAKVGMVINGKEYTAIQVANGSYRYYAGGKITSINDTVTMIAYDKSGKELDRAQVALTKENPSQGTLTANPFTIGKDGYVTGNFTGDVAKVGMVINGKEYTAIQVANGSYRYYAGGKIVSVNDTVTMIAYDKSGKELNRANVKLNNDAPEMGTIAANPFTIGQDSYVKGSYTGNAARVGLIVNGKEYSRVAVNGGSYQYYAGGKILTVNDDVYAVLYDAKRA